VPEEEEEYIDEPPEREDSLLSALLGVPESDDGTYVASLLQGVSGGFTYLAVYNLKNNSSRRDSSSILVFRI